MKKELKSGILSADKSADCRPTVGGVNVIADAQCLVSGNKFKSATSLRRHLKRHEMEVMIHIFVA